MSDPCILTGDQDISDAILDRNVDRFTSLANDLLYGQLSFEDWVQRMKDGIELAYVHQAIAGTPDQDERQLSDDDLARIQDSIQEQYNYLDGFVADIEAAVNADGASLNFIPARSALYAKSSRKAFWGQATNGANLPAQPGDGDSECLTNCLCSWECRDGQWYWVLGETDAHCPTCLKRASEWSPYEG